MFNIDTEVKPKVVHVSDGTSFMIKSDPVFHMFRITLKAGRVPDSLSGAYTTLSLAEQAINQHLSGQARVLKIVEEAVEPPTLVTKTDVKEAKKAQKEAEKKAAFNIEGLVNVT
jgi:hypothetical protein